MELNEIELLVKNQREYFLTGETLSYNFRRSNLLKLRKALIDNKEEIFTAFINDFNKSRFDVLSTEFGIVMKELDYMLKHLRSFMKERRVKTDVINLPSHGKIIKEPYGTVLVIAPWNYPLQLSFCPLIGALGAGNTVVLKPSSYAGNTSEVFKRILDGIFDEKYVATVLGGRNEIGGLLDQHFDYIFFTGSPTVGHLVQEKASKHLTPISLELGGKSPTIVDCDADIKLSAKRITWGKFLNAGQTCVAPDYVLVHESLHDKFVEEVKQNIQKFYYTDGKIDSDFPYIITEKHFNRVKGLIDESKVVCGGKCNGRLIEPTVMDNVTFDDAVMQEEIFGPIMPIITFNNLDELIDSQRRLPKPLALYYFGNNKQSINKVLYGISSGGACINEVIMHLTNDNLPFGGVGNSGMGSYHGEKSFYTFTHEKSVLIKDKAELDLKYPKANKKKEKLVETMMKVK